MNDGSQPAPEHARAFQRLRVSWIGAERVRAIPWPVGVPITVFAVVLAIVGLILAIPVAIVVMLLLLLRRGYSRLILAIGGRRDGRRNVRVIRRDP